VQGAYEFYDVDITGKKDIVKEMGLEVLPYIHIFQGADKVESFSCSVSKTPILKEKLQMHLKRL
jgi:thioredoxin-like negative regulator of GroEL